MREPDDLNCAPSSTYRLQLNHEFTFDGARELVDYLYNLGIGACYVSPILKARAGSMHGYDVIDHSALNPEIGSMESLERFVARLREFGMGLIVDIVPNHMCVSDLSNWRWCDVLENGPSSTQAHFFDIDWNPPREDLADKVLLPSLGDQYGRVLEDQQLRLEYVGGAFGVRYYDSVFPIAPRTWPEILKPALETVRLRLGGRDEHVLELESIITALGYLPMRNELDQERIRERQREKEIIKRRLLALSTDSAAVAEAIAESVQAINGRKGEPASFDSLEKLLADQAYRLSFWRVAADEVNYRRFFDINELAAIRTEDPAVFDETHRLIFELIAKGWVTGLRVDHPDGLSDPASYFEALQKACAPAAGPPRGKFFVVAEKIVAAGESLRDWQVEGTTGYGFLNDLNGLFVHAGSARSFCQLYERWTGSDLSVGELFFRSKRLILRASMSSELYVLARRLDRICQQHRHSRDFTLEGLRFALAELLACFPVYRTYVTANHSRPDEEDRRHIQAAIEQAKGRNPSLSESLFDAIGSLLLLEDPEGIGEEQKAERRLFAMRFQQLTAPVMAKGVEDTAFYRYYPLASLNEVGGDPGRFGATPRHFHRKNQVRLRKWPRALLATTTHDTKRSEDVRARINALSEIPMEWYAAVRRWSERNAPARSDAGGLRLPDRNAEYLLYQTLVGTWPLTPPDRAALAEFTRRIQDYMEKALKEAKVHTSWVNPNRRYDQAMRDFVAAILDPSQSAQFLDDFAAFARPVARAGMFNSLAQLTLKVAAPGVPDFYQGTETWNFTLVDPDNRRSVDFAPLRSALAEIDRAAADHPGEMAEDLWRTAEDGRIKLYLTSRGLRHRRLHRELFEAGSYAALEASGGRKGHAAGFARRHSGEVAIAVAGRFFLKLRPGAESPLGPEVWGDTALLLPKAARAESFTDIFTGAILTPQRRGERLTLPMAEVFATMPVAILEGRRE